MTCIELLHRHPSEVNLKLDEMIELMVYYNMKKKAEEKAMKAAK